MERGRGERGEISFTRRLRGLFRRNRDGPSSTDPAPEKVAQASIDPARKEVFDRVLACRDGYRRLDGSTFELGPFTLYTDYARPTLGASVFTSEDVRKLIKVANEKPQWKSIDPKALIVEWGELEWIDERVPALMDAVTRAGLKPYNNPLLAKVPDDRRAPILPDATVEVRRGGEDYFVADVLVGGQSVGGGIHEVYADVSEITSVYVEAPFRRRGYGTAIAAALAGDAFSRGIDLIFVESASEAVRMYERAGFDVIGTVARAPLRAPLW